MWSIKFKATWKTVFLTLIAILVLYLIFENLWPSKARSALPANAENIQEHYYYDAYLLPDYVRLLKADVDLSGFQYFISELDLSRGHCLTLETTHMWSDHKDIGWWRPSGDFEGTVCAKGSGVRDYVVAKHENGTSYFEATRW